MKNRMLEDRKNKVKNGKFWCWHKWAVYGPVGKNRDLSFGLKLEARCAKCGRNARVPTIAREDVPDRIVRLGIPYE